MTVPRVLLLAVAALAWQLPAHAQAPDTTPIYYCTDATGKRSVRNHACPKGQKQEIRQLPTPKPSPAPVVVRSAAPAPPSPPPQVVVVQAPRPLYECVTPDGDTYTSDSAEGHPRFVPLWTLGYPVLAEQTVVTPGGGQLSYSRGRLGGSFHTGSMHQVVVPTAAGYGAGAWVRDQCHALPQSDVCGRLRDQLSDLRTRFFNAMPSERDRITAQERAITARLANDCR